MYVEQTVTYKLMVTQFLIIIKLGLLNRGASEVCAVTLFLTM